MSGEKDKEDDNLLAKTLDKGGASFRESFERP
jgi:hypothetical protein